MKPPPASTLIVRCPPASLARMLRAWRPTTPIRSEEHTSELQSLRHLVCRLLLEKKYSHLHGGWFAARASCGTPVEVIRIGGPPDFPRTRQAGIVFFFLFIRRHRNSTLFPPTALFQ